MEQFFIEKNKKKNFLFEIFIFFEKVRKVSTGQNPNNWTKIGVS